jgi:hypothetical protein
MIDSTTQACRVLVPAGVLGAGCPQDAFDRGLLLSPHAIAVDGGSTDSGPYYLGAGVSKMTRKATKRDLRQLMIGRERLGIPLLVGSCGTSGTDAGVDWMASICQEIAAEEGHAVRIALVYSEQSKEQLFKYLAAGAITVLPPAKELTRSRLVECDHIVGLLGYEALAAAITAGADIVLSGRTTDTAVLAAVPLMRGLPAAACWHAAKIAECGGQCTANSRLGGVMISIDRDGFDVEPLHSNNYCTPYSVSAHMLYENADPYVLKEPGVLLDATHAKYEQLTERSVRVTGGLCEKTPYTMKLEGSGVVGYRAMLFSAIADPKVLAELDTWLTRLTEYLTHGIHSVLGFSAGDYQLEIRPYGWNALDPTSGRNARPPAQEVGLMTLVTAGAQTEATEIAKFCNPALLHFPLNPSDPLPSYAFPFSPAEVELGALYEFKLNHVVHLADPLELTRTVFIKTERSQRHGAG